MKETVKIIGPCSEYIAGQGWTTEVPVDKLKELGFIKLGEDTIVIQRAEYEKLKELESKKEPKKYWAIVGYRNYVGKYGYHIEYVSIEYEKDFDRVSVNVGGRLFVTRKDLLFKTKAEAKEKLKEIEQWQ